MLLLGLEMVYNFLFLAYILLVMVLFYKRRTNLPRLLSIYYLINFVGPLLDLVAVELLTQDLLENQEMAETDTGILSSFIAAVIWIPYFNLAERVKSTFCKRYTHLPKGHELYE